MTRKLACVFAITTIVISFLGCGPGNPQGRKAVSGRVTLDGAPIESGSIDFQPLQAGGTSSGSMITNGNYQMAEEEGLPVGKYRVTITAAPPQPASLPAGYMPGDDLPPAPPPKQKVPPEWNAKEQTIEVKPDGPMEFNFAIESSKTEKPKAEAETPKPETPKK
jgi:hypothetical protein